MSHKHKLAAKARAAKMPDGYFSKIAKKQHEQLTPKQKRRNALRLVRARRAKMAERESDFD